MTRLDRRARGATLPRAALAGLATLAACAPAYRPVARTVRTQDLGNGDRTRLTARFVWDDGTPEHSPPGTSPETVTDTAILAHHEDRLCVHLELRTGAKHDAPFGEWNPTINGEPVFPEQETATEQVYSVAGERSVVDAAFLSSVAAGALSITEPTTDEYAVIHRRAWFCPSAPAPRLELKLQREFRSLTATQGFVWTVL